MNVTIREVARAVVSSDAAPLSAKVDVVEGTLDIALRMVIGMNSAVDKAPVIVDLGNGFELSCEARKNGKPRPMGLRG